MTEHNRQKLVLETAFIKAVRKDNHIIITDKNDYEMVVIGIEELDNIYSIIHAPIME